MLPIGLEQADVDRMVAALRGVPKRRFPPLAAANAASEGLEWRSRRCRLRSSPASPSDPSCGRSREKQILQAAPMDSNIVIL